LVTDTLNYVEFNVCQLAAVSSVDYIFAGLTVYHTVNTVLRKKPAILKIAADDFSTPVYLKWINDGTDDTVTGIAFDATYLYLTVNKGDTA
jgi:hypothetical protein